MSTASAIPLSDPLIGDQMDRKPGTRHSTKRLAQIAGVLYLIVGIFGGFAVGYANPAVYVPGDATTTAANVAANSGLVRAGVLADLLQATAFVFLAMVLYVLLKDVEEQDSGEGDGHLGRHRDHHDVPERGLPVLRPACGQ